MTSHIPEVKKVKAKIYHAEYFRKNRARINRLRLAWYHRTKVLKGQWRIIDGSKYRPIHHVWWEMIKRCTNPKHPSYKHYGGRGIKVCDRWLDPNNFIQDMKDTYKKGLCIDRINNNGNYEPSNCRWATYKENANNRRNNAYIEYNGETKTISQWADHLNMKVTTLWYYLRVKNVPINTLIKKEGK